MWPYIHKNDENRSGRPVEVATPEMVSRIYDIVLKSLRINVLEIIDATGISVE